MKFFEEDASSIFDEEETVDVCECGECGAEFEVEEGLEPDECPICGCTFDGER